MFEQNTDSNVSIDPQPIDVLCGRGRTAFKHEGNQRLRDQIIENALRFARASSKPEKSAIVRSVLKYVQSSGGRFLKRIKGATGMWQLATYIESRDRVSHALRDAVANKVKSMPRVVKDSQKRLNRLNGGPGVDISHQLISQTMSGLRTKKAKSKQRFQPLILDLPPSAPTRCSDTDNAYAMIGDNFFVSVTLRDMKWHSRINNAADTYEKHLHPSLNQLLSPDAAQYHAMESSCCPPLADSLSSPYAATCTTPLDESLDLFINSSGAEETEAEIQKTLDEMTSQLEADAFTSGDVITVAAIDDDDISDWSVSLDTAIFEDDATVVC